MATDSPGSRDEGGLPDEAVTDFLGLLNELKATGCSLLVVGDAGPDLFARASATLLGDPESLRYRLVAATDATPDAVASRLPNPDQSPRPLAETARVVDYDATSRSAASSATASSADPPNATPSTEPTGGPGSSDEPAGPAGTPTDSAEVPTVGASDLDELGDALADGVEAFGEEAADHRPATLRVGVDSVDALVERHGDEAVREWIEAVGDRVRARDGMAHFVLREPYDSERATALADAVDAVIEVRSVDAEVRGHDAEQRWHVPDLDATVGWVRL